MANAGWGLELILGGALLLILGTVRGGGRHHRVPGGTQRWLTIGGLALLTIGFWIRMASLAPAVGGCPTVAGAQSASHCFHGAPWPAHGSSR